MYSVHIHNKIPARKQAQLLYSKYLQNMTRLWIVLNYQIRVYNVVFQDFHLNQYEPNNK